MSDKLLMENYLLILKSTIEVYIHGTLESSNREIRKILKKNLDNTITSQENTFNIMKDFNFYKIENISKEKINNNLNKLNEN